jgi:iron transport multicopper oxidase
MIEADVNDTIVVNTRNLLGNETTSLHFHGMAQRGTIVADGPAGVTQCPIEPGQTYTQTFKAYPAVSNVLTRTAYETIADFLPQHPGNTLVP